MTRLSLNSISNSVFAVNGADKARSEIVSMGRILMTESARKGQVALNAAQGIIGAGSSKLSDADYREYNEKFQAEHLLYAARLAAEQVGAAGPENYESFKRNGMKYYTDKAFFKVLQSIYEEIIGPILPRVYSEAVSPFADTVPVGFGETCEITVASNDIVIFQDSSWGASRSVPVNTLYMDEITINPAPRSATLKFKWTQLVSNGFDFGRFFANMTAGLYAKTMGMFAAALNAASADTTKIPTGLTYNFTNLNWARLANKLSAVNNTNIGNLVAYGNTVALSKVLPTQTTGTTNADMDAAIATLLGEDYVNSGYLGKYLGVVLAPLMDAVVPGTQNGDVDTILPEDKIWMLAASARKPFTIAMNVETPISIEFDPTKSGDFMIGANLTTALSIAAVFAQHIGLVNI